MDPERWRQIDALFGAALERASDQREAFLDRACRDDRDLRREVEALLAEESDLGDFLEEPITSMPGIDVELDTASEAGRSIGVERLDFGDRWADQARVVGMAAGADSVER